MGCFQLLAVLNHVAVNICAQVFVSTYVFISLRYTPRNEIAGSYRNSMFINLLRNCQTIFQSIGTILNSHQQHVRVPITPCHTLVLYLSFLNIAMLVAVKW